MKEGIVARRWAKAFFSLAVETGKVDVFARELARIQAAARTVPQLIRALGDELVERDHRRHVVDELAKPLGLTLPTVHFIKLLIDRERTHLLPLLIAAYQKMDENLRQLSAVDLTVAESAIADAAADQVRTILKKLLGREIRCQIAVDPNIVGGMVVRVGDVVYDGSVRGRLQRMKETLLPGA